MIFGSGAINWMWYYEMEWEGDKLRMIKSWRLHKYDHPDHPKVDHWISSWSDKNGRSGIDLDHYNKTGETVSIPKDYVNFEGRRVEVIRD